jgi:hypothetical protein
VPAIVRLQEALVEEWARFCTLLRTRTTAELEDLRRRFTAAVWHEYGSHTDYRNVCWVCKADVGVASNDECEGGWLICADGACQCPDWSDGYKDTQPVCQQQIDRLSREVYEALVSRAATSAPTLGRG